MTYTVNFRNGGGLMTIEGHVPCKNYDEAVCCADLLGRTYRDISITEDETGRVMFSVYIDSDVFTPELPEGKCLDICKTHLE